jgi:hypothetical protein
MIRWWIETGAWPLPHAVRGTTLYFKSSDVCVWLQAGTWPVGARFRGEADEDKTTSNLNGNFIT